MQQRINTMKHLLSSVAMVAALAISAPAWAQPYGAGSGAQADQPVNPRAPYDRPVPPSWSKNAQSAAPSSTSAPAAMPPSTSANPPMHRHARAHHAATAHGKMSKM